MKNLLVITGQTATGKTSLAVSFAKKINGELINSDSRQIYKHLDIVTGKDLDILQTSTVHLYDIVDPKKRFSSYDFTVFAKKAIKTIEDKGETPIIVGGTYFYLKHLIYGIATTQEADWKLRNKLNKKSIKELQVMLRLKNPDKLKQMNQSDRANPHRLIRQIELSQIPTAKKMLQNSLIKKYKVRFIGLRFKRKEDLIKKIRERVEKRMKNGDIEEVRSLFKKGYSEKDPGLQTIGYKQLIALVKGRLTKDEAIKEWISKEVRYAKRQYTFMKKDKNIKWKMVD